jgi:hypothetical protein
MPGIVLVAVLDRVQYVFSFVGWAFSTATDGGQRNSNPSVVHLHETPFGSFIVFIDNLSFA